MPLIHTLEDDRRFIPNVEQNMKRNKYEICKINTLLLITCLIKCPEEKCGDYRLGKASKPQGDDDFLG